MKVKYFCYVSVPNWVSGMSQKLLMLTRWTSSLHGSFCPHLAVSVHRTMNIKGLELSASLFHST